LETLTGQIRLRDLAAQGYSIRGLGCRIYNLTSKFRRCYKALERARELEAGRGVAPSAQIPAIALAAFGRSEDRLRSLTAGFRRHVAKPVEPAELAMVIASIVLRKE
jgi:hypothetical protein